MGLALMVTDEGFLDQAPFTKIFTIEGVGYFDLHNISTTLDPKIDRLPRQRNEQELDGSSFPTRKCWGRYVSGENDEIEYLLQLSRA